MSEGFHLLRLHDSSLTPVYDARCTLTISPMASSTACVSRRTAATREPLLDLQVIELDVRSYYSVEVRPSSHIIM
jgi:hypothetical protein